jgi:uncharacterized damage-inducible protein DinB
MQPTDPAHVLLAHDHWANLELYACCRSLSSEQLHQPFQMGTGSIHNNLVHNLGAMRGWTDVLNESEQRPRLEASELSLSEIEEMHERVHTEFKQAAFARPLDTVLTPNRNGRVFRFTAGGILTHVTTHSMHHRAQCLNMLRQLGVEQLPMSSVMEWMITHSEQ